MIVPTSSVGDDVKSSALNLPHARQHPALMSPPPHDSGSPRRQRGRVRQPVGDAGGRGALRFVGQGGRPDRGGRDPGEHAGRQPKTRPAELVLLEQAAAEQQRVVGVDAAPDAGREQVGQRVRRQVADAQFDVARRADVQADT
jgi:hypothetical protein